jgi:hypothetical protein
LPQSDENFPGVDALWRAYSAGPPAWESLRRERARRRAAGERNKDRKPPTNDRLLLGV